jgi:hypothetical protein
LFRLDRDRNSLLRLFSSGCIPGQQTLNKDGKYGC